MRQNIHDRRRKRGGPGRKKSTDQRRPSAECSATPEAEAPAEAPAQVPGEAAAASLHSPLPCLSEVEEQLSPKEVEDEIKSDQEDAAVADSRDEAQKN